MSKKPVAAGKSSFDLINIHQFFSNVDIRQAAQLLDLGCGTGRYSIEISKLLAGKSLIHAVDFWDKGIDSLKSKILREKI